MPAHPTRTAVLVLVSAIVVAGSAGCRSRGDVAVPGSARSIHMEAVKDLRNQNLRTRSRSSRRSRRYPFSEEGNRGSSICSTRIQNHEANRRSIRADQFIRENPTHPRTDYAYYIKGLGVFRGRRELPRASLPRRHLEASPQEARQSFQSFQTLVQRFPKSPYAADARQRMIYLRNKLADYELAIARYYMKRGAYVGAPTGPGRDRNL
jgi:outer membrane protein assembly factor BamD